MSIEFSSEVHSQNFMINLFQYFMINSEVHAYLKHYFLHKAQDKERREWEEMEGGGG